MTIILRSALIWALICISSALELTLAEAVAFSPIAVMAFTLVQVALSECLDQPAPPRRG